MIPVIVKLCESPGRAGGLPLINYLIRYNNMDHRSEAHSRMEDWHSIYLPPASVNSGVGG